MEELERSYKFKHLLQVRDVCNIMGISRSEFHRKYNEGFFHEMGELPESEDRKGRRIPKMVLFEYLRSLYETN
jgi:predicted DNA-binding transcriptional regulator AlpA